MKYYFELENAKERKLNKKKLIGILVLGGILIVLAILCGVKVASYEQGKKYAQQLEEQANQLQEEQRLAQFKKEEEEAEKLKNVQPLTEEQVQAIENIYNSPKEKSVFLTFDDGPTSAVTPYILDLLKQENIKATFFVLGNRAKANPDLIKREFEEGHYIANHGYTHKYSQIYTSPQAVLDEYHYTDNCIKEALGNPNYQSRVFRFPGGSVGGYYHTIKKEAKEVLRQNGIVSLDWNCLSKDADGAHTKEALLKNIIDTAGQKQSVVVLMHDAADKILTYEALPEVIQFFRDNGYVFKNLYDILSQ